MKHSTFLPLSAAGTFSHVRPIEAIRRQRIPKTPDGNLLNVKADNPYLTASLTILGGVVVFCITSVFNRLVLEPFFQLRKSIGEVSYCMQYHAWVFHMGRDAASKERYEKVFEDVRSATARLRVDANAVVGYWCFSMFRLLPPHGDLIEACGCLIGLSNTLSMERWDENHQRFTEAGRLLRIDVGRPSFKRDAKGNA